jgi:hypothetical protein
MPYKNCVFVAPANTIIPHLAWFKPFWPSVPIFRRSDSVMHQT